MLVTGPKGPKESYTYSGYYLMSASGGMNSLLAKNKGKRKIKFHDGQTIDFTFTNELYSGTFWGNTKHESSGGLSFKDVENNISAEIKINKVKKKPSDYICGDIIQDGEVKSKVYGSYLGFVDFDGKRYYDHREQLPCKLFFPKNTLESDH